MGLLIASGTSCTARELGKTTQDANRPRTPEALQKSFLIAYAMKYQPCRFPLVNDLEGTGSRSIPSDQCRSRQLS